MPSNSTQHPRHYAILGVVLVATTAIVVVIALLARDRIDANQRAWFLARLDALVPAALHDNSLYADRIVIVSPGLLGTDAPITVFRARSGRQPRAAIFTAIAPDGYGGAIELLIAVDYSATLLGVDVLRHNETQGIGDSFEPSRSNWLNTLKGRSLRDPQPARWTIRKDGGDFDQFTSASITPRAILKAVRRTLDYYSTHRERIFDAPAIDDAARTH